MAKAPCTLDRPTRELLTLAAKAAGIEILEWVGDQANVNMDGGHYGWNPLARWGGSEALSLAAKLDLAVIPYPIYASPKHSVLVKRYERRAVLREQPTVEVIELYGGDPMAATQRAIVRAAALLAEQSAPVVPAPEVGCEKDGGSVAGCGSSPMCGCPAALEQLESVADAQSSAACWCATCNPGVIQMFVCPDCGCKRCPRAESHESACTGKLIAVATASGVAHTCSGCAETRARLDAAVQAARGAMSADFTRERT